MVMKIIHEWEQHTHDNLVVHLAIVLFLDSSKAFGCVNPNSLIFQLKQMYVPNFIIPSIFEFLQGCTKMV